MLRYVLILAAALLAIAFPAPTSAQVFVVSSCGTVPTSQATLSAGNPGMFFVDGNGVLCTSANYPAASGGLSKSYATLANSTNATVVKASAGQIYNVMAFNNSANIAYLKFYNKATTPTCNSDTVVDKYLIPASTSGAGVAISIPLGDTYSTGISYCVTGAIGDTDNTSVAASAFSVTIRYK